MTPLKAIREFCVQCVGGDAERLEVKTCGGDRCLTPGQGCDAEGVCLLYKYRMGRGRPSVKTIRKYCLYCQGNNSEHVRECSENCFLHDYRLGTNPNRKCVGGQGIRFTPKKLLSASPSPEFPTFSE